MSDDLERAQALKAHIERAAAAKERELDRLQSQKPDERQRGPEPERTTSFAKQVDPGALDRARSAKEDFQRAAAGAQQSIDRAQGEKQKEPRSHQPEPGRAPRPRTPEAQNQDRETFQERQERERERARALQTEAENRRKQQEMVNLEKAGQEKDRSK